MEIGIAKKGDIEVLTVKGKIRLQSWRVLDKHLETLRDNGCRWLVMDMSGVSLICSTGIGSILHNAKKFQENEGGLILLCSTPYLRDLFEMFGFGAFRNDFFFTDWESLENRLR